MEIETLKDVLQWTKDYHQKLADCMQHCADEQHSERSKLLLQYLAKHEHKLATVIEGFQTTGNEHALNTWCYEYFDKSPIDVHRQCDKPFAQMSTQEIIAAIEDMHQQLVFLYRYLSGRADIPSAIELLEQLTALEEHEAMQMVHAGNRLEDI
jgi:hypothetical protein